MTMDIKVGDVVHVRATVVRAADEDGEVRVWVNRRLGTAQQLFIAASEIVHVEPRPLQVGDQCRVFGHLVKIACLGGDSAWVQYLDESYGTVHLSKVERLA